MSDNEKEMIQEETPEEEVQEETEAAEDSQQNLEDEAERLAELEEKIQELEDKNIRLQAEIQNLQRRNRKDREDSAKFRSQKLAESLIPVIDNLERVLSVEVRTEEGENIQKGIEMVLASFYQAFESENIEVIDPEGEVFDPNVHEAVNMLPADDSQESGTIAQVLAKGYVLNGRTLRAAQVAIYQ